MAAERGAGACRLNDAEEKRIATACAIAALRGIEAVPSRDDRGRATIILRRGVWVREVTPDRLAEALEEARAKLEEAPG